MELFIKGDGVKLRSHLDKYLAADDDRETVRQSRNGDSRRAVWTVETVAEKPNLIRLRSCHGTYLTASNKPFLLGMTGEKVVQTASSNKPMDWQTQWEPVRDGFQVKMKSWCGKWLRANGGSPPWRNSVTHDEPHTSKTKDWILWDLIVVDGDPETMSFGGESVCSSPVSSHRDGSDLGSPSSVMSMKSFGRLSFGLPLSPRWTPKPKTSSNLGEVPAMEFFQKAKAVRMRSVHDKYLTADEDEETVAQDRNGSSKNARWIVEPVRDSFHVIRLKSCHGKYLTASNERVLLGATGRKVVQSKPSRLDSSVEWEPLKEGSKIKLRTRYGKYLRANGGVPPWRNSVTHDIPHRTSTQDWILWEVDVVEILVDPHPTPASPPPKQPSPPSRRSSSPISRSHSGSSTPSSVSAKSDHLFGQESNESQPNSPPKLEGRTIYYHIADESGHVEDESTVGYALTFKGNSVEQLTQALREATSMDDVIVCTRSPLNGKLFPLRLQLPPTTTMHVVLVPSTSRLARELASGLRL
ncbi:PREDICTED: uncharacterized protein LOC104822933 [Tarenaya hassleriana]|uniref:uncharacterized protein LOC104822933 n=1 Tax=Tarenaya hassleriana TaxID=28532 RepID=UPI00053C9712|nr:PREDICTED: uncharacterized protein LOC104822933 [Tarenaya hassleriana]